MRNQFYLTYQRKEDEITRLAKEEFNKGNMEIKEEDSGDMDLDESESKSFSKNSKTS